MKYCVLDIETEGKEYRSRFCDPLESKNKVVMIQLKYPEAEPIVVYDPKDDLRNFDFTDALHDVSLLIGQNFKFDMLYLWGNDSLRQWLRGGGSLWDTKTADFILNSCRKDIRYALNNLGERYGLGHKMDIVTEYYKGRERLVKNKAGVRKKIKEKPLTTLQIIDKLGLDEYKKYAIRDVVLTEKVFLNQSSLAEQWKMGTLLVDYMNYYKTIIETEYNGMSVDKKFLDHTLITLHDDIQRDLSLLDTMIRKHNIAWQDIGFNVDSNDHLSVLCFGGQLSYTIKEENGVFKTGPKKGQLKYKNLLKLVDIPGITKPTKALAIPVKKQGFYKVDKEVLETLVNKDPIIKDILDYKKLNKLVTDFEKIQKNLNPYTHCLHSEFNTTATVTGRLSSSNPGSQNLHPETKKYFNSRYEKGVIIELDWSQMEVAVAAYIFNEPLLKQEILSGIDLHLHNAQLLTNKLDVTQAERKTAKFMTFGILYGQSAYGLAKTHGMSKDQAQGFIDRFYGKYINIQKCHNRLKMMVETNPSFDADNGYFYQHLQAPNNKRYFIRSWDQGTFKFPQYANYMIQGTAGDIHAYCVGKLFTLLLQYWDKCYIINNIHDSILLDCKREYANDISKLIKKTMEQFAKEYTNTTLFTIDAKIGTTWGECQ